MGGQIGATRWRMDLRRLTRYAALTVPVSNASPRRDLAGWGAPETLSVLARFDELRQLRFDAGALSVRKSARSRPWSGDVTGRVYFAVRRAAAAAGGTDFMHERAPLTARRAGGIGV